MKRNEGRWADVEPGMYVRSEKDGQTYKVLRWDHARATIQARDGTTIRVSPDPYSRVTYFTLTMKDAMTAVLGAFPGAEVIHDTKEGIT